MQPNSARWLYLVTGQDPSYWKQATLSICSLLHHTAGRARILVYTDQPSRYDWLRPRVETATLDASLLDSWLGPNRFFFRAKPCLLKHHTERHPLEPLFYLDSDTLCLGDPHPLENRLGQGAFLMHCEEYPVCDGRTKERREYRRHLLDRPLSGGLTLRQDSIMWNAGLLGIHPGDFPVLTDVLQAIDEMGALGLSPRTRLKEQLAFSLAGARTGRLAAIGESFIHYWGNKEAWERWTDRWLAEVLGRDLSPLEAGAFLLNLPPPPPPVAPRKSKAERRKAKLRKWLRLD